MSMFEFNMRAVEKDPTEYYFPRWDQAEKLTIIAETRAEAMKKAKSLLGDTGNKRGWPWTITIDVVKEIKNAQEAGDE